jgi:hypothetical protein
MSEAVALLLPPPTALEDVPIRKLLHCRRLRHRLTTITLLHQLHFQISLLANSIAVIMRLTVRISLSRLTAWKQFRHHDLRNCMILHARDYTPDHMTRGESASQTQPIK